MKRRIVVGLLIGFVVVQGLYIVATTEKPTQDYVIDTEITYVENITNNEATVVDFENDTRLNNEIIESFLNKSFNKKEMGEGSSTLLRAPSKYQPELYTQLNQSFFNDTRTGNTLIYVEYRNNIFKLRMIKTPLGNI